MAHDSFEVLDYCCSSFPNHFNSLVGKRAMSQPLDTFNEKMVAFPVQSLMNPRNDH